MPRRQHRAGDGLASGHRVDLQERYDYPFLGPLRWGLVCIYGLRQVHFIFLGAVPEIRIYAVK